MQDIVAWLYGLQSHGIKLGLSGTSALLALLDHPERSFATALIGGTNGKGSVAAMVDSMLKAHGVRSGLYTSPHLVRPNERIRIGGVDASSAELDRCLAAVRAACETGLRDGRLTAHPSFFEVMTAAALLAFREARVDIAVLEVGLGGRLDATNATEPLVSAIVTVDLDHVAILGGTIADIAAEKAAIARPGRPLISGITQPPAIEVVRRHCEKIGAAFHDARGHPLPEPFDLPLPGEHQQGNARIAVAAFEAIARAIELRVEPEALVRGLAATRWPGRLQLVAGSPPVLLDGAHNVAGSRALARYLASLSGPRPVLIFAAMADKDAGAILEPLVPHVLSVVTTHPAVLRAAEAEALAAMARELGLPAESRPEPAEALRRASELAGPSGLVLVAGSLYLVGAVLAVLEGSEAPGPVSM